MSQWVFHSGRRLGWALAGACVVIVLAVVIVLWIRVSALNERVQGSPGGDASRPIVTSQALPEADPLSTPGVTGLPDEQFSFPDAGDPLPVAVQAADDWASANYEALEGITEPGTFEDMSDNDAPEGFRVDGAARTLESGPTMAEVQIPTTSGPLYVNLRVAEGEWVVYGFGFEK